MFLQEVSSSKKIAEIKINLISSLDVNGQIQMVPVGIVEVDERSPLIEDC